MEWSAAIAAVLLFTLILVLVAKAVRARRFPYRKKESLFSNAERAFLGVLDQAVGGDYRVFGKVRVADVVAVTGGRNNARQAALNRITGKHFDFVLCHKETLAVVAAVELDDGTHNRKDRRDRDRFLDDLCAGIGLPLIRVEAQRAYSVGRLRETIAGKLEDPFLDRLAPIRAGTSGPDTSRARQTPGTAGGRPDPGSDAPSCPECASPMVLRTVRKGGKKGLEFWGCAGFPKCRGVLPVSMDPGQGGAALGRGGG